MSSPVHYVNAYLWESQGYEPASHGDRTRAIIHAAVLRGVAESYGFLSAFAFEARYQPIFEASRDDLREIVNFDLRQVERAAMLALNLTVPTWEIRSGPS